MAEFNINPNLLVRDFSPIGQGVKDISNVVREENRQEEMNQILQGLEQEQQTALQLRENPDMLRLIELNPQVGKFVFDTALLNDQEIAKRAQGQINSDGRRAFSLLKLNGEEQRAALLADAREAAIKANQATDADEREGFLAQAAELARMAKLDDIRLRGELEGDLLQSQLSDKVINSVLGTQGRPITVSEGQTVITPGGEVIFKGAKSSKELEDELKREKTRFDQAAKLRGEVEKINKPFREIQDSFNRVKASQLGDVNAASDLSLVF